MSSDLNQHVISNQEMMIKESKIDLSENVRKHSSVSPIYHQMNHLVSLYGGFLTFYTFYSYGISKIDRRIEKHLIPIAHR